MNLSTELQAALRTVLRHTAMPVAGLCVGVLGALAVTAVLPRTYEAAASVLITAGGQDPAADDGARPTDLTVAQGLLPTIARLAESREVAADAAASLNLSVGTAFGHLRGSYEPGLQVITVTATAKSKAGAAALADAATAALSRQLVRLRIGGATPVQARSLDRADRPTEPVSPRPLPNGALGALVGLLAGLGLKTLRDRLDDRLRGLDRIERRLGLPVLGVFPRLSRRLLRHGLRHAADRPDVADAVNATVAALAVLGAGTPQRQRLVVTSALGGDQEGVVAGLLALGLAEHHEQVTLVDGSLCRPGTSTRFPEQVAALDDGDVTAVYHDETDDVLATLADRSGVVVVHAPPVLAGADLTVLAAAADVVLLVVRNGRSGATQARRAARLVGRLRVPLAGVLVINASGEAGLLEQETPPAALAPVPAPARAQRSPTGTARRGRSTRALSGTTK